MSEKNANEASPVEEGRKLANFILKALLANIVQDEEKRLPADVCEELLFRQGPIASDLHSGGGNVQEFACGRLKRMLTYLWKAIANIRRVANERQRTTERVKSRTTALKY